ncbi:MAG: hypothetical protein QXS69_00845, partial [Candidatus Aenigmatarchaeota archaeon]
SILGAFSVAIFVAMFLAGAFFRGYGFIRERHFDIGQRLRGIRANIIKDAYNEALQAIESAGSAGDVQSAILNIFAKKVGYTLSKEEMEKLEGLSNLELNTAKKNGKDLLNEIANKLK